MAEELRDITEVLADPIPDHIAQQKPSSNDGVSLRVCGKNRVIRATDATDLPPLQIHGRAFPGAGDHAPFNA